jgi:hypothetical protein
MVLTIRLIAIASGLSEAVEVALVALLPMYNRGDDFSETDITKR